ncbi:MAG: UbiA prenyltransferase family protein [Candidatus Lernaella stagnicola]|nr:UbiA prenyltransferase family protein [Candidatus Lernaella stagnicola]
MRKLWQYLQATRPIESCLMIGFPLIGTFIALQAWSGIGLLIVKFFIATYPLVMYVYCLNSFGGLEHDRINARLNMNPAVTGEVSPRELVMLSLGGAFLSGLLYYFWFPNCLLPWLLIVANWTFYSHPRIYAKSRPIFGTLVHFVGGVLQFLLGYAAARPIDAEGVLIGAYFSLVFSAGHLNHEVKDYEPDQVAGLQTNAVVYGPRRMFSIAFAVFTLAFFYLLILAWHDVIPWRYAGPYLLIYVPHLALHVRATRGEWKGYDRTYQVVYRTLFVLAGLALAASKWLALR